MGYTAWYFAIDSMNEAHPLTQKAAGAVFTQDYSLPPGLPDRDEHGVLIAEVIVGLENTIPVEIQRIHLNPVPRDEASRGARVSIGRGVAAGLQMALRRKLGRRTGVPQGIEAKACAALAQRIDAGEFADAAYRTHWDRLQQAAAWLGGERFTHP